MKHVLAAVAACFGIALAILLLSWTTYFSQLNSSAYDLTLRMAGELKPASPTLIVAIDEESLRHVGPWPWTRDKLAQLIETVQKSSPSAIGVDILLDEAGTVEQNDELLATAIAHAPKIVLAAHTASGPNPQWLKPFARFLQPNVLLGHVHADPDIDGITRGIYSAKEDSAGKEMPAFALQALKAAGFHVVGNFVQQDGNAEILHPEFVNIRFNGGRDTFPHVAAAEVLDNRTAPDVFKGRIVLIGLTAEGLQDEWFTPFSTKDGQKMSGVEIHANAIDTFFTSLAIRETPWPLMLVMISAIGLLLWRLDRDRRLEGIRFYFCAVMMLPLSAALSWALMKYSNLWLPFPPLWAAIILIVPGLEALEIVKVNRDLDEKIARLAVWNPEKNGWLAPLDGESEGETRSARKKRLFAARHRNARWRLHAVDFFNEDLVRFLSFTNAILTSIDDAIIAADSTGHVVYQNAAARRLAGYAEQPPAAPEYVAALLDGRSFTGLFQNVRNGSGTATLEFIPSSDRKRYYNVTLTPTAESGVVISLNDSSARFELNQAKNDMVSLVSHELRTPLTSIRGYSDMLVKYDLVAEKGKPFLATIIDESRRLGGLIQSFLDIAYIESGRQKITVTDFEIAPVMKDMLSILGPVAASKEIRLETPLDDPHAGPTHVRADRLLLYQALSNLVTNAIKYSPSGTTVCLTVSNGDGRVRFQVADEGCGIPAAEADRIFEKFYRRANKETREQSGFGLGLAFVKEVAVKHGGDVFVESEVGKGSVFTFWVPN